MLKTILALAAALATTALVLPTVSHAQTTDSIAVPYSGINLGELAGQQQLKRRVSNAADIVCAAGMSPDLAVVQADRACTSGAIARAAPSVQAAIDNYRRGSVEVLGSAAGITVSAH